MIATDKCSQCSEPGVDVSTLEGTAPEGFRALCPGRMDGSEPEALFCESCASGPTDEETLAKVGPKAEKAFMRAARKVKPAPRPAGEVKVRSGPVDPERAAKHEKVGLVDRKHAVWATLPGEAEVKLGEGSPEVCAALASALRSGEVDAAGAVAVVREMERERLEERAARKGKKS